MHYLLESLFIGFYTALIYLFFKVFSIRNPYILLFIIGFFKHLLGSILNLHNYYCNYGYACISCKVPGSQPSIKKSNATFVEIFIETILEGLLFIFVGGFLFMFSILRKNKLITFFLLGFLLHSSFEILGIHKLYCQKRCIALRRRPSKE